MLLLIVWIAVAVLAAVVLGGIAYGLLGAVARLRKEVTGAAADLGPVLDDVRTTLAVVERRQEQAPSPADHGNPANGTGPHPSPA